MIKLTQLVVCLALLLGCDDVTLKKAPADQEIFLSIVKDDGRSVLRAAGKMPNLVISPFGDGGLEIHDSKGRLILRAEPLDSKKIRVLKSDPLWDIRMPRNDE